MMEYTKLVVVFMFALLVKDHYCKSVNEMTFQHMKKLIDESELDTLRQKNEVSAVYYFKRDIPRLKGFLRELDKTAEYLKMYGVEVGFFDCGNQHKEPKEVKCLEQNSEFSIHTYRSGHILLDLGLDTMFDINSIMSNILQLVLIRDVPILQTVQERIEYENKQKGHKDIIFTYQKAIGTYEHRIFMEVAFAYQDKFEFAVCTNKQAVQDLKEYTSNPIEKTFWVLRCKDWAYKEINCPAVHVFKKHDLASLASFVKSLTFPLVFKMPEDGNEIPWYSEKDRPVAFIFYDKLTQKKALKLAKTVAEAFYTIVGVVAVNLGKMSKEEKSEINFIGSLPGVAFHAKQDVEPIFMKDEFEVEKIQQFLIDNMNKNAGLVMDDHEMHEVSDTGPGDIVTMEDEEFEREAHAGEQFDDDEIESVETQDDVVADAVFQSRGKPPKVDLIDALTDKTFPTTIKNKDLVFVLFYLPFDDKSMAFLYSYADASREIENDPTRPLTRVNCHDWTDVCGLEKIISYPTVRMYRHGKKLKDYNGLLDSKAVVTTVKLLNQTNPVHLPDSEAIMNLMNGVLPNGQQVVSETVVMALLDKTDKKERKIFKEVSRQLEDMMTFAINDDGAAKKIPNFEFKVPSIIVLRRSDILKPHTVYNGNIETEELKDFIVKTSIPSMPELTVELFPRMYRQDKPLVILFKDSYQESGRVKKVMEDVVLSGKFPTLQFVWMNAEPATIGKSVLAEYNKNGIVPAISYVNLKQGIVYNSQSQYPEEDSVSKWLTDILEENIEPSKILEQGDWKPKTKGYDFLKLIDKEKERKKKKQKSGQLDENYFNDQGIGFDNEGREINLDEERERMEKESGYQEDEIREELMELHKTRLYKSGAGRRHKDHKVSSPDSGGNMGKSQPKTKEHQSKHTEL